MSLTIELDSDLERMLDERVASGQFASREEAVLYAVRLLDRKSPDARDRRARAVEDMREIASRNTLGPDLTIRTLIDEGRRY